MKLHRTKQPIVLNMLQLRLAIKLAAQQAAQLEIKRQVEQQYPGRDITVEGCPIHAEKLDFAPFTVLDREVVWE